MSDSEFAGQNGQTLTKAPGTINGESFVLKDLTDCTVYLLDYSSEVEVSNCSDCRIFIGPVDGATIFTKCTGCQVAVACQQFQARNCSDIEFGLYCATNPSITNSHGVRISCWMGAYPTLTAHFAAANLDPEANNWDKVYDVSSEEGGPQGFELVDAVQYWEVPLEGHGPLQNPVPGSDGSQYQAPREGADSNGDAGFGDFGGGGATFGGSQAAAAPNGLLGGGTGIFGSGGSSAQATGGTPRSGGAAGGGMASGGGGLGGMGGLGSESENPRVAEMRERIRKRLAEQEESERRTKSDTVQKAAGYLEQYYERRNTTKAQREKQNREEEKLVTIAGPKGDTIWEKSIDYINFGFQRPNGSDLGRLKGLLFTAKAKNVPIKLQPGAAK